VSHAASSLLEVENLCVGYAGTHVLDGVSFTVKPGQVWAILGQNGVGKSTLLRAILGLLQGSTGEVRVSGRPRGHWSPKEWAQKVGWVPQSMEAPAEFTGLELLLMGRHPHLGSFGLLSAQDFERARRALGRLGMAHLENRLSAQMSGGERRLLGLARALVQSPSVLLLDEPTAFLDLKHQVEALEVVREYARAGHAAVAVLHDMNLAANFADAVLLLKEGRVLAQGAPADVLTPSMLEALYGVSMTKATVHGQMLFAPRVAS
jgi:iron complex transport system ATP-binding protein